MPDYGMLSSGLSSFHPLARNPWDLSRRPRRLVGGRGRGGGGGLRAAASRHRHRRLDPAARRLVRPRRPEAQRRPRADRPALYRPRRRADDAHRRRCGADDGDAVASPTRATIMSLPPADARLARLAARARGPAHRPAARHRLRRARRARDVRAAIERAARDFERRGADRRAARAAFTPGRCSTAWTCSGARAR